MSNSQNPTRDDIALSRFLSFRIVTLPALCLRIFALASFSSLQFRSLWKSIRDWSLASSSSDMEVEARSLASSFPYSLDKIDISRDFLPHDSPDMPSTGSDGVKSGGLHSPESGDRKCEEFEMPMLSDEDGMMDATGNSPVVQVEVEVEEEVSEGACSDKAAVKLQKVYRSYRTRRRLADSAVVAEELW